MDYRQQMKSVSHHCKVQELQIFLDSLHPNHSMPESQPSEHWNPISLDSLAFVTPSTEQALSSASDSDHEDLLTVAHATGLTLFDPRNVEESESEPEID